MNVVYLDHNGSAPLAAEVVEAMRPWLGGIPGNPASSHVYGKQGKAAIENARRQVSLLLGCLPEEIVFTSGGTESNNLVLKGLADTKSSGHFVTTAVEHPSILHPLRYLKKRGFDFSVAGVDSEGVSDAAQVAELFRPDTILLSMMLANNETGSYQPVKEAARYARKKGILIHCDAAQVVGKEIVKVDDLDVDLLTISGHKLNAPKGVGVLYIRKGVVLEPLLHGAGHESGMRSGTQDVLEIVGLGAAAERFERNSGEITGEYLSLRKYFETELKSRIPDLAVNGPKDTRLVNTVNFAFPNVKSGELLAAVPNVAAAPGAACHKDHSTPSHVLAAMGISNERAESSVRFSLGHGTTKEQLHEAAVKLAEAYLRLRRN